MAGEVNVDALLRRITAKQFMGWEAYFQLEPFGAERDNWHAAGIREMLYHMHVSPQHQRPLADFRILFGQKKSTEEQPNRQSWQLQKQIMMAVALAYSVPAKDM
jgi:hypothetical protein